MPSLLEAAAAAALGAAVLALGTASMTSAARIDAEARRVADGISRARQLEHLVDRAALAAGSGPRQPSPLSSLSTTAAVFHADLDGSGEVDATTSETTALEVSQDGATARIRVKIGRQTMTVLESAPGDAWISGFDTAGRPANAATASLLQLEIVPRQDAAAGTRTLRFAVPARFLP